jgi:predicted Na+-dependent transporter
MLGLRTLLSMLGTQGARGMSIALCISAFVPVIYPGSGAMLRPSLPLMIAVFLINAFAQLDVSHAKRNVARPLKLLLATCWAMLVIPILFWATLKIVGRDRVGGELATLA